MVLSIHTMSDNLPELVGLECHLMMLAKHYSFLVTVLIVLSVSVGTEPLLLLLLKHRLFSL